MRPVAKQPLCFFPYKKTGDGVNVKGYEDWEKDKPFFTSTAFLQKPLFLTNALSFSLKVKAKTSPLVKRERLLFFLKHLFS
jgi:hypothetical protein